jgi:hypothetical protein
MLTILLGLIPAALLRWAILRNPLSRGVSVGISAAIWIAGFILLSALEVKTSMIGPTISPVAVISYFIFRSGSKPEKAPKP